MHVQAMWYPRASTYGAVYGPETHSEPVLDPCKHLVRRTNSSPLYSPYSYATVLHTKIAYAGDEKR